MKLTKFLQFIGISTAICLSYVHMQMTIIDMAYKGKAREKEIRQLIEENGSVTYTILTLKSSSHLGLTLLSGDSQMHFADAENIIRVKSDEDISEKKLAASQIINTADKQSIFDIMPFGRSAEAQIRNAR